MEGDGGGGHGAPPDTVLTDADGGLLRWGAVIKCPCAIIKFLRRSNTLSFGAALAGRSFACPLKGPVHLQIQHFEVMGAFGRGIKNPFFRPFFWDGEEN